MHRERTLDRRSPDFRDRRARMRGLDRFEGCGIEWKSASGKAARPALSRTGAAESPEGMPNQPGSLAAPGPAETGAMLRRMRAVLARELNSLCGEGGGADEAATGEAGGKAAVDLMSLIVRTLEKIDLMERAIAAGESVTAAQEMSPDEREALRARVRGIVERLARQRLAELVAAGEADADGEHS